jgi:4-amino-4-deoxy-L-arabinose transferase-like glycosyltransferase
MGITEERTIPFWELGLIAATRGAIGFGAGLLLADRLKRDKRKAVGWSLFLAGLASTIPLAWDVFGSKEEKK